MNHGSGNFLFRVQGGNVAVANGNGFVPEGHSFVCLELVTSYCLGEELVRRKRRHDTRFEAGHKANTLQLQEQRLGSGGLWVINKQANRRA